MIHQIQLNEGAYHRWLTNLDFKTRVRRRAIRMGRDGNEVQILDPMGIVVDLVPSDRDARAAGYRIDRS